MDKQFEDRLPLRERFDRGLITSNWFLKFLGTRVTHLSCNSSKHLPSIIYLTGLEIHQKIKYLDLKRCGCLMLDVGKLWRLHGLQLGIWIIQGLFCRKWISVVRT